MGHGVLTAASYLEEVVVSQGLKVDHTLKLSENLPNFCDTETRPMYFGSILFSNYVHFAKVKPCPALSTKSRIPRLKAMIAEMLLCALFGDEHFDSTWQLTGDGWKGLDCWSSHLPKYVPHVYATKSQRIPIN